MTFDGSARPRGPGAPRPRGPAAQIGKLGPASGVQRRPRAFSSLFASLFASPAEGRLFQSSAGAQGLLPIFPAAGASRGWAR